MPCCPVATIPKSSPCIYLILFHSHHASYPAQLLSLSKLHKAARPQDSKATYQACEGPVKRRRAGQADSYRQQCGWGALQVTACWVTPPLPPSSRVTPTCIASLVQFAPLKQGIAKFYNESSGLWESVWGEHMHHGEHATTGGPPQPTALSTPARLCRAQL